LKLRLKDLKIVNVDGYDYFIIPKSSYNEQIGGFSSYNDAPKDDDILIKYTHL